MSIIAILISLAMMLTGASVDGQPQEAFRTLVLHDISITYNDQNVTLAPSLVLGASTDGEKAVFDLGVLTEDDTLFPMQIGVNDEGVTALLQNGDVAVRVSADALYALTESLSEQFAGIMDNFTTGMESAIEGDDSQLLPILMNEYIPAYAALIEAAGDPEYQKDVRAKAEAAYDRIVDRGEGTPVTELVEGESYELTAYSYSIEGDKLAELADAVYTCDDTLSAFYNALFKLYSVMPEESGLNGLTSFADLFAKFNLDMRIDMEEKTSGDGEVMLEDAVLTLDMSRMIETMSAGEDAQELPKFAPIVMNIHAVKANGVEEVEVSSDFDADEVGMDLNVDARSEEDGGMRMNMTMALRQGGASIVDMDIAMNRVVGSEESTTKLDYGFSAEGARLSYSINSVEQSNGVSENRVDVSGAVNGMEFGLGFCLDVTYDLIEDQANGHEAFVINDLSEEGLKALSEDQAFGAIMMQALGSLSGDAQKLMADESVQELVGLFGASEDAYEDDDIEDDDDFYADDGFEYEEPEDDGVLPFNTPEITWLPEGWKIDEVNTDTAYDMVDVAISDGGYDNYAYVIFYSDTDNIQTSYVVAEDGSVGPVNGREITVYDYGDGSLYVMLTESGVSANISITSPTIDMETIGKLVAGIKF